MAQRTCEVEGCEKPHRARGMCGAHYGTWYKRTFADAYRRSKDSERKFEPTCVVCGATWLTTRKDAKFCSDACKGRYYSETRRTRCVLPDDHPVRMEMERQAEVRRVSRDAKKFAWRTARECPGCGSSFTPLHTPNMLTCSMRCHRRVRRWRRNAVERSAVGTFTWSQFMHIARRFDYRCAYCGVKPRDLDPEHVVPLSRGGHNSTTNLLPACRPCNADKRDLLLDEWAADREARGKPPRTTTWAAEDKRYWHLTQHIPAATAA